MFFLTLLSMKASAQITTSDCENTYSYCSADTVRLVPQDQVTYSNFVWYGGSVAPANAINAGNAAGFNVDPTRLGANTIYVSAPGGTYILTAEYATPGGCATKNDTLVINFLPVPDLVTTADTLCASAGEEVDLATLVTDANGTTGALPAWYPTLTDAENETNVLGSTTVNPSSTTKYYVRKNTTATDAEGSSCYNIDSVQVVVQCLNLGNFVWYDTNNDGIKDAGEAAISGVTVELFYDVDGDGVIDPSEQTPYATETTDGSGLYLFEGLPEGKFFVGIPSSEFGSGKQLSQLFSSGTSISNGGANSEVAPPDPDAVASDTDDNGQLQKVGFYAGGVMTIAPVMLNYGVEPTGENPDNSTIADANDNLTVDFGFYGMSIGSNVFADVDNDGTQDVGEDGIANVMVILYAGNGTTPLDTTYTDTNGDYIFTNLPEGNYVVGVNADDTDLDGQHSSTDIVTSGTPETTDLDDNGTGTGGGGVIKSSTITLDAGTEPTGDTGLVGNALTPDVNTNNHIDFGFVPDCPTITNPTGAQTICSTDSGTNLTVDASATSGDISFIRYTTAQTGNAMYTGGTQIGTDVTPVAGTATYTFNTADFPNATTSPITYYVYAIMAAPSADPTCRPYQEIQVVVNPKPTAAPASLAVCENTLGGGQGTFTLSDADDTVDGSQTGITVTYHPTLTDANNDTNQLPDSYTGNAGSIFARAENAQGCFATSTITLTVNSLPDFTLALATVCPGENPEVTISNLLNASPLNAQVAVNGAGAYLYTDLAADNITTAEGLNLNATNTVTVTNTATGCSMDKTIVVPNITPLVCPPVNVTVRRAGE